MEKQQQQSADQAPSADVLMDTSFEDLWELFSHRLLSDAFLDSLILAIQNRTRTLILLNKKKVTNGTNIFLGTYCKFFKKKIQQK